MSGPGFVGALAALSPRVWYRFEEISGKSCADESGFYDASFTSGDISLNTPGLVAGSLSGIAFSGTSLPPVTMPSFLYELSFPFTFVFIAAQGSQSGARFLSSPSSSASYRFIFTLNQNASGSLSPGNIRIYSARASFTNETNCVSSSADSRLYDGSPHLYIVEYGSSGLPLVWIDGDQHILTGTFGRSSFPNLQHTLSSNEASSIKGRLDEYAVISRALTLQERSNLVQSYLGVA